LPFCACCTFHLRVDLRGRALLEQSINRAGEIAWVHCVNASEVPHEVQHVRTSVLLVASHSPVLNNLYLELFHVVVYDLRTKLVDRKLTVMLQQQSQKTLPQLVLRSLLVYFKKAIFIECGYKLR